MKCLAFGSSALLLAGACAAQLQVYPLPTRGVLLSFQLGMVLDDDLSRITLKQAGRRGALDAYPDRSSGNVIDASTQALVAHVQTIKPGADWTPHYDGLTSLNDNLPIELVDPDDTVPGDEYYQVRDAGAPSWAMLELVLENGTVTGTTETLDNVEVLGYYFANQGFPSQLRSGVYRELVRSDFASGAVPAPTGTDGIAALDAGLGIIEATDGQIQEGIIDHIHHLYFSLTAENADELDGQGLFQEPVDGATIFHVRFSNAPTSFGEIELFEIYKTGAQLGLPEGADIDALAMAVAPNEPDSTDPDVHQLLQGSLLHVISFATGTGADQLSVVADVRRNVQNPQGPQGQVRRPLHDQNGNPLVGPSGTLTGNVRGVCNYDPEGAFKSSAAAFPFEDEITEARSNVSMFAVAGGSAVGSTSEYNPVQHDAFTLHGCVSGWGTLPPQPSWMWIWVSVDGEDGYWPLPPRGAADDVYDFEIPLLFLRDQSPGGQLRNDYEASVFAVPIANPVQAFFSVQVQFQRWYDQ